MEVGVGVVPFLAPLVPLGQALVPAGVELQVQTVSSAGQACVEESLVFLAEVGLPPVGQTYEATG